MKNISTKCLEGKIFLFAFPSPQPLSRAFYCSDELTFRQFPKLETHFLYDSKILEFLIQ